jgi:hypothetical protein
VANCGEGLKKEMHEDDSKVFEVMLQYFSLKDRFEG